MCANILPNLLGSNLYRKSIALFSSVTGATPAPLFACTCASKRNLKLMTYSLSPCLSDAYLVSCSRMLSWSIGSSNPKICVRCVRRIISQRMTQSRASSAAGNPGSSRTFPWDPVDMASHIMDQTFFSSDLCCAIFLFLDVKHSSLSLAKTAAVAIIGNGPPSTAAGATGM